MYSIHEKLIELCPIIKELLVDEGVFKAPPAGLVGGGNRGGGVDPEQLE